MLNTIFTENVSIMQIVIMLVSGLVLGILSTLVFTYKKSHTDSFALTLTLLPMISSIIIFLVNDHLGAGFAVAGAFTLVRFRSIAGNGRQMVAIFASMTLGLILGMGYIGFAVLVFAVIALVTIVLTAAGFGDAEVKRVTIVVPESLDYDGLFEDIFSRYTDSHKLEKVRTINMGTLYELTYNVTFNKSGISRAFIDEIRVRNGNMKVSVGDYAQGDDL